MRAFIAILLDPPLREALTACEKALQAAHPHPRLKWVGDEQHHLTLHFLGEITPAQVQAVTAALRTLPPPRAKLTLGLAGLGAFPSLRRPTTLWVGGTDASGYIAALATAVGRELRRLGAPVETRPFSPHFTLARVPRDLDPSGLHAISKWFAARMALAPPPLTQQVSAFYLMRSDLLPSGARYTAMAEFRLDS